MTTKTKIMQVREKYPNHIIIIETVPNTQIHKNRYPFKTQQEANEFLKNTDNKNLWYISDYDKPIKLHIDFDYPIVEDGDFEKGVELYNKVKDLIEGEVIAVAERKGDNKLSRRIFTNMEFENTETLKYYMKDFILKNHLSKDIVDTSIYSKNRLYPIVNYNIKKDRMMTWTKCHEGDLELCNPNNNIEGVKIKFDVPVAIEKRKQHGKKKIQEYKTETKDINKLLFLDLLNIIPATTWDIYTEWFKLATFCKTYFDLTLFIAISRTGNSFESEEECTILYNGIKSTINAGYIVNKAKEVSSQRVNEIYYTHRWTKEILTSKNLAEAGVFYFGNKFRKSKYKKIQYYFDKVENKWREADLTDYIKLIDTELKERIKPLLKEDDNKKMENRFETVISNNIDSFIKFFGAYIDKIEDTDFNNNKNLLFFKNGHYNFDEKCFKYVKSQEYFNTKCIDFDYHNTTNTKKQYLIDFFRKIFPYEEDFTILKNVWGTAYTGTSQKYILFIVGNGDNGKSAMFPLLQEAFGSYAVNSTTSILTEEIGPIKSRNDIAPLHNARFVVIQEPDTTKELNPASVKILTGSDIIESRLQFSKESLKFVFHGLINTSGNKYPNMNEGDNAVFNRLIPIIAPSQFKKQNEYDMIEDKTNVYLADPYYISQEFKEDYKLTMVNLLIDWANEYRDIDVVKSQRVLDNAEEFNDNEVGDFIDENYQVSNNKDIVPLADAYILFRQLNGNEIGRNKFYELVKEKYSKYYCRRKYINNKPHKNILVGFKLIKDATEGEED